MYDKHNVHGRSGTRPSRGIRPRRAVHLERTKEVQGEMGWLLGCKRRMAGPVANRRGDDEGLEQDLVFTFSTDLVVMLVAW